MPKPRVNNEKTIKKMSANRLELLELVFPLEAGMCESPLEGQKFRLVILKHTTKKLLILVTTMNQVVIKHPKILLRWRQS